MRFRIGEPISSQVGKKIANLQNVFGSRSGQDRDKYVELQSAVPWIRMQSAVEIQPYKDKDGNISEEEKIRARNLAQEYGVEPGDNLAKKYILHGVNTRIESNGVVTYEPDSGILPGYENTADFGIRPKPGITGMSIRSHNRFGSLRTATVQFQCWSKEQIDALELLYMRPGYSVLLEWGHSKNLTVNGASVEEIDLGIDFYSLPKKSADTVYNKIAEKRITNHYGYDAILGQIKNFSWKLRSDGGYDCTTELISPGELIESYKANFFLPQDVIQADLDRALKNYQNLTGNLVTFPNVSVDTDTVPFNLSAVPQVVSLYRSFLGQANVSLGKAKQQFKAKITAEEAVGGDALSTLLTTIIGSITSTDVKKDLQTLSEIFDLVVIAQGGSTYGTVNVNVAGPLVNTPVGGQVAPTWTEKAEIKLASPWREGIVDFNIGNNYKSGTLDINLPDGGNLALIPSNFEQFINKVEALTFSASATGGRISTAIQNILKIASDTEWDWQSASLWTGKPNEDYVTPNNIGASNKWTSLTLSPVDSQTKEGQTLQKASAPYLVTTNVQGKHFYKRTDIPEYSANLGQAVDFSPRSYNFSLPSLGVSLEAGYSVVPPVKFIPITYKGFNVTSTERADINVADDTSITEELPSDNYLSKLHYYLRTFVEVSYTSEHLGKPQATETFKDRFQYRTLPAEQLINALDGSSVKLPSNYSTPSSVKKEVENILGGTFVSLQENNSNYRDYVYVKFSTLLELINKHILRSDDDYFFTFVTNYDEGYAPLYYTWSDHISADPRYCILPHTVGENVLNLSNHDKNRVAPKILDIELSVNFILECLDEYLGDDASVKLLDFIQKILDNITRVTGGVNDLQLQYLEDDYRIDADGSLKVFRSKFHIVDRKVLAPITRNTFIDNNSYFNLFGLNSIIQNVDLVSKLTPKISSTIAISAQASPFTSTEEATGFNAINANLEDKIFTRRYEMEREASEQAAKAKDFKTARAALNNQIVGVLQHLGFYYEKAIVPPIATDEQIGVYENYCKFIIGVSNQYGDNNVSKSRATYNFIIPFELTVTLHGISGIKVMDAFVSSQDILPRTYGGRLNSPVAFLVVGVEHKIARTGWTTQLRTQIYNIDESKVFEDPYKNNNLIQNFKLAVKDIALNYQAAGAGKGELTVAQPTGAKGSPGAVAGPTPIEAMNDYTPGLSANWLPVERGYGATVSSAHTADRNGRPHAGIDIAAKAGAPVYSTVDGEVQFADILMPRPVPNSGAGTPPASEPGGGYGQYATLVKASDGYYYVFGHLRGRAINLQHGSKIKKGELIGYVGSRGTSTAPHLHYEITSNLAGRQSSQFPQRRWKDPIVHLNSFARLDLLNLFPTCEIFQ